MKETIQENLGVIEGTTAIGADGREALSKRWVAALVQVRNEKAVGKKLTDLKIENYVATQWEIHQWSDRKKKVEQVVIPMIVFIHTDKVSERKIITYSFIHKLLSYPGKRTPAIIPDVQIERLKFMLKQSKISIELRNQIFKTGETVRIVRGPLKDLEGELCRVDADKPMVAVQIDCLGYACVSVSKNDLMVVTKK